MDLEQRFEMVGCEHAISIAELKMNTPYSIVKVVRSNSRFGQVILITIRDDSNRLSRVFLPRRYLSVFTDNDILKTDGETKFQIIYHGRREKSGAFQFVANNC
jgi:hypothetical protein